MYDCTLPRRLGLHTRLALLAAAAAICAPVQADPPHLRRQGTAM